MMKKHTGFTLIEIMISLTIGLIVVGATIGIYLATVGSSSNTIKSSRLNHDLESTLTLMTNDIRRAGYWGGARANSVLTAANTSFNNPFTAANTDIRIHSNNTIVYSYDADLDGTVDTDECFGFKLESNTLKIRQSVDNVANCNSSGGNWEEFVEGNQLKITNLQFSFTPLAAAAPFPAMAATSRCLNVTTDTPIDATAASICPVVTNAGDSVGQKRLVNIQLGGELDNDSSVKKYLSGTVEIRNNRLCCKQGGACTWVQTCP